MALVIRLRQQGKTNRQFFRLVVADKRSPRDGKHLEILGWYDPFVETEKNVSVKTDRVQHWIDQGATLSDKAKALIKRAAPEVVKGINERKLTKPKKTKSSS